MNTSVWWESQLERDYIYLLEIDPDVITYKSQPLTIAYDNRDKKRKYTPDFLVERKSYGQIVEVKPKSKVKEFSQTNRFRQALNFCSTHNLEFMVVTEKTIRVQPRLDNIKLLYRYARLATPWHICAECLNYFNLVETSTLFESESNLKAKGITYSYLLRLLWNGFLLTDMMQPITAQSVLQLSPSTIDWESRREE